MGKKLQAKAKQPHHNRHRSAPHGSSTSSSSKASPTPLPPPAATAAAAAPSALGMGLDLGGSLTKICYFQAYKDEDAPVLRRYVSGEDEEASAIRDEKLSFDSKLFGGKFHFIYFQTAMTRQAISVIHTLAKGKTVGSEIHATGGGAIKFAKFIREELGVALLPEDELETVVRGIVFTLLEHPQTCYTLESNTFERVEVGETLEDLFPLLVVNIGSGVSIIKVDSPDTMRRVSGTAVGGGTFFGLCKLLTRCETFDEAMDMAGRGDATAVNMLVSDIYGGSYERVGLLGTITASFFGKAAAGGNRARARPASSGSHEDVLTARRERSEGAWYSFLRASAPYHFLLAVITCYALQHLASARVQLVFFIVTLLATVGFAAYLSKRRREFRRAFPPKTSREEVFRDEDIAKALVTMISQNVTQIAYLNAKMHQTKRIVFTGNFLRHNAIALETLTSNLALFSGGEIQALFTEHEGFFGALGAFLMSDPAKEKLARTKLEAVPRSSFHAPEEGDDGFYLSSPQVTPRIPPLSSAAASGIYKQLNGMTL